MKSFRVLVFNGDQPSISKIVHEDVLADEAKKHCNATVVFDDDNELQRTKNQVENYKELLDTANAQIFECCRALGIDTDVYPGDGWTLHQACLSLMEKLKSYAGK